MLYTQFDFNCAFGLVVARGRAAISDDDFTVSYPCRKVNVSSVATHRAECKSFRKALTIVVKHGDDENPRKNVTGKQSISSAHEDFSEKNNKVVAGNFTMARPNKFLRRYFASVDNLVKFESRARSILSLDDKHICDTDQSRSVERNDCVGLAQLLRGSLYWREHSAQT